MNTDRPLDWASSIKVKLAVLVGASILVVTGVVAIGEKAGVPLWLSLPVTVAAALGLTQWLARGMTAPLREMTIAARRMAGGDYGARVTATTADEVGELARAFTTMAADLAATDEERRRLIATVSHELRTPLTAQRALLENLVDGVVAPDDEQLGVALAQAERLSTLVSDLLDLSRIDAGRAPLATELVDVAGLVAGSVAEAGPGAALRKITVTTEVPTDLTVTADPARLAQLLANLLDNAVRHSPVGGEVRVRADRAGYNQWFLEVADDGPGMPPDRRNLLVDRFGTGETAGGGTGLGLAICRWVAELHGGTVRAVDPPTGATGAVLRVVLPVDPTVHIPPPEAVVMGPVPAPAVPAARMPVPPAAPAPARPPSVIDEFFARVWPDRGPVTATAYLVAALLIGLFAAVTLPYRNIGLAVFLVLVAAGAVALIASPRRRHPWTIASAVLALGLGSMVVIRADEGIGVLGLLVSAVLVTTALTGARSLPAMVVGAVGWPMSGLRGLPLLGRTVTSARRDSQFWPVARTVAASVVVVIVFGAIFSSADPVLGAWTDAIVPELAWASLTFRVFVLVMVGGLVLTACHLALNPPPVERVSLGPARPLRNRWEWLVPLGLVITTFVAFLAAQATAMFGGADHLRRTTGLTYAEYVHQGFGQLVLATLLTLVVVAVVARKAPRDSATDRLALRIGLGVLCGLTLLVVASALYRMHVYQTAYGFTVLRVFVDGFEIWLGLLVVMVLVAGVRLSARWLPRAALASAAVMVLVFGLMNPAGWVAERNIDRFHATGNLDVAYLHALGPDATPAIAAGGLPAELTECLLLSRREPVRDDLLAWNLGRARAADRAGLGPERDFGCIDHLGRPSQEP